MNKTGQIILVVLGGFVALLIVAAIGFGIYGVRSYNNLVKLDEGVKAQWSQVENVYQRRSDLIPNLVATVKGYAEHERETLEGVVEARAKATQVTVDPTKLDAAAIQNFQQAQGGLSSALGRLMVVMERYPDLKANENFRDLQAQLEGTENRITVERGRFNETAQAFNTYRRVFPRNIVANITGFQDKAYFEAEKGAEKAPVVDFKN